MRTTAPLTPVPVSVLLVDPQEICRRGIACTLDDDPAVDVVGQTGTVSQAHQLVELLRPNVVVLDSRLPDGCGVELCRRLRRTAPTGIELLVGSLTDRESAVPRLITDGMTNRQIGEVLLLSEKTAKNYISGVLAELGVQRRTQAAVLGSDARELLAVGR